MAGHSHSRKIKEQKRLNDARKGTLFAKLSRALAVASRDGGLEAVIERARKAGMSNDRIQAAIERSKSTRDERRIYAARSAEGVQLLIEWLADNSNRTVAEVRSILQRHGAALLPPRSVLSQVGFLASAALETALITELETCEDVDRVRGFQ